MAGPVMETVYVSEHDRGGRWQTGCVRCADHVEPFCGRQLVRADHAAHVVAEDLRRRTGQRRKAGITQPREKAVDRQIERLCPVEDLEWGECMHVQLWLRALDRSDDLQIRPSGVIRVDTSL